MVNVPVKQDIKTESQRIRIFNKKIIASELIPIVHQDFKIPEHFVVAHIKNAFKEVGQHGKFIVGTIKIVHMRKELKNIDRLLDIENNIEIVMELDHKLVKIQFMISEKKWSRVQNWQCR